MVKIWQENFADPEARSAALGAAFDQETAAQLVRCYEPHYRTAYRWATSVSDDPSVRKKFAAALQEYLQLRGQPERQQRLLEALGEDGVAIVHAAGW